MSPLTQQELVGLQVMRSLNTDYLNGGNISECATKFLASSHHDDQLLLKFLRGRKFNAKFAWETLKRYAEIRFDIYPELFKPENSDKIYSLATESNIGGVLKVRDKYGRRVDVFDIGAWDTEKYSVDEIITALVKLVDTTYIKYDMNLKGTVVIIQCLGLEMKHLKHCTRRTLQKAIDILLHAYPTQMKATYVVNAPYIISGAVNLVKCLLPKKLKNRVYVTSGDCHSYKELMELVPIQELPKSFGGPREFYDAVEDFGSLFC